MITYLKKSIKDKELRVINSAELGSWINVVSPTKKDISFLVKEFGLDKDNLNSGIDPHEIPRADFINGDSYIYVKVPADDLEKGTFTFLMIVTKEFILTFSQQEPTFFKQIFNNSVEGLFTTQKTKFLLHLLSLNNTLLEYKTLQIVKSIEMKNDLSKELREKDVNEMIKHEYTLNSFVSAYNYTNFMYNKIIHRLGFHEKDKDILEELIIDTEEGQNICQTSLKNISNIRSYSMVLLTSRLNRLITVLTVVTVFLSVVAAVSSIYGMNITIPLQEDKDAFLYVMFFIAVVWVIFIGYLKKKKVI